MNDADCGDAGFCSMNQEDSNGYGIGMPAISVKVISIVTKMLMELMPSHSRLILAEATSIIRALMIHPATVILTVTTM